MSEQQLAEQNKGEVIAVVLKVNHLEAVADGFEEGSLLGIVHYNENIFKDQDTMVNWVNGLKIVEGVTDGYDYAVAKVVPSNIDVYVGPGDFIVVYEDGHFGCYVGVGGLSVIDGKVIVGR